MTSQITKDFQMKSKLRKLADGGSPNPSMLGLADGGGLMDRVRNFINPPDDRTDTDIAAGVPKPGSPEENKELARRVTQQPGMFPTYSRSRLRADMNAEYQQRKKDAGPATGLADGGTYLGDEYNTNIYQQSQLRDGGRVDGPGGRTDDKVGPVMLSDEEYVLPGDTADAIGRDKLDAIRLATHEFKDERKESALRGRADGGDGWYDDMMPMDHLADGGNPWIADASGNVRKPNAFGDAAAGPGYQQPRLPPPQPGTAVGPARTPPMGQRPPIDMGVVEEVPRQALRGPAASPGAAPWSGPTPTNPNVGPNGSREAQAFRNAAGNSFGDAAAASKNASLSRVWSGARSLLNAGGKLGAVGLAGAGIAGGMEPDSTDRYAERFGVSPPTGDGSLGDLAKFSALRAGGFASDMGSALTFGLADKLYRDKQAVDTNMMASSAGAVGGGLLGKGVGNVVGGALDAGAGLVSRGRYKGNVFSKALGGLGGVVGAGAGMYAGKTLSGAGGDGGAGGPVSGAGAPAAAASPTSALRSDQGPALPVTPDSYQSRRLSEMGVPLDVQNSNPVVNSATGSTRDFLRTGGTSQYQNLGTYGGNGNIYGKADDPSRPGRINNFVGVGAGASPANEANGSGSGSGAYGAIQSALRGLGNGPSAPGGSNSGGGPTMSVIGGNNHWYDQARKDILSSGVSVGRMTQQLVELANIRAGRENNRDTNAQNGANAHLTAETARQNAERTERASLLNTLGDLERTRATVASQTQAAQLKVLQDAQKYADERQDKGEAATRDWIKGRFTSKGADDKQVFDSGAAAEFTDFLGSGKAMVGPPENRRPLMSLPPQERLAALPDVYQDWSVNEAINTPGGLIGGGRTTNSPGKLVARPATVADLANGLPLSEYLGTKFVPGYESNVVERTTDRKVRAVKAVAGDDLERKKAILRAAGKE